MQATSEHAHASDLATSIYVDRSSKVVIIWSLDLSMCDCVLMAVKSSTESGSQVRPLKDPLLAPAILVVVEICRQRPSKTVGEGGVVSELCDMGRAEMKRLCP